MGPQSFNSGGEKSTSAPGKQGLVAAHARRLSRRQDYAGEMRCARHASKISEAPLTAESLHFAYSAALRFASADPLAEKGSPRASRRRSSPLAGVRMTTLIF